MALSSSSPVVENCQCRDRETVSDAISALRCRHRDSVRTDDLLPYEPLCSYWARGQVFIAIQCCLSTVMIGRKEGLQF